MNKATQLLDKALLKVESESIKKWVNGQREIWVKIAQLYVDKKVGNPKGLALDELLHLDIIVEAIGL